MKIRYSAQIVDASGQLHLSNKLQAAVSVENRSLMPGDYATRLSADEITNIVGFLRMQQGRDQNKIVAQPVAGGVSYQRLLNAKAEPHNWMMYWGDYSGQHYSALTQITPANARQLKTAWSFPILGGNSMLEATPIVVDGVMYTTGSGNPATVTAHRRAVRPSDLAMDPAAEDREPLRDQPVLPRRRDPRQPDFRRHARRRAGRARRADRPNAVGTAGRRHDGRLEHHEPAARVEGHGHHRA